MAAPVPSGCELRLARANDGPAVRALVFSVLAEYGLQSDPENTDADLNDIEAFYCKPGGCFHVLIDSARQRIIGSVGLLPLGDGSCELRKMYLDRAYRGRGLGKLLLQHAIAEARRLGFKRVVLETAAVLKEAGALYRSFGFTSATKDHVASRCDTVLALDLE